MEREKEIIIIEKIAAGLRALSEYNKPEPVAFIFNNQTGEAWEKETICGIPVYHTDYFCINDDSGCPFLPVWLVWKENGLDTRLFTKSYTDF